MTLTPYQILVPVISFFAMLYAWNFVLRKKKTIWEAGLWTIFWGVIGFIALKPSILSYLSAITGIKDQVNAIFVTSIGILFFMVFYIVIRIEELSQRQTRLVREIALRDADFDKTGQKTKENGGK